MVAASEVRGRGVGRVGRADPQGTRSPGYGAISATMKDQSFFSEPQQVNI